MSLTIKFALFTSTLCILIIAGITYMSYLISYRELERSLGMELEAIVRTGAIGINGDLHDQIKSMDDVNGEAFQTIRNHLLDIKNANQLDTEVYTFRQMGEQLMFIAMTNEKPYVGDTYSIRSEMRPTLTEGKPAHTGVYGDAHGEWISAYAPIRDSNGNLSGLLEADYRVETFFALLREKFLYLMLKSLGFAAIAVIASFLLAKSVTRKLVFLTNITEKISLGKLDKSIEVRGKDEVSNLAASLERMRESLVIAAKMLD
jgi:methyl-accepting chemotaxis protein